jgi:hypothetical protein
MRRPHSSLEAHRGDSGKLEDRAFWNYMMLPSIDGESEVQLRESMKLPLPESRHALRAER